MGFYLDVILTASVTYYAKGKLNEMDRGALFKKMEVEAL